MQDLVEAARGAIFEAIEAAHAGGSVQILDAVGQDEAVPFIAIDDIEWQNEGGKDEPLLRVTFTLVTLYRGSARGVLLGLLGTTFDALHNVELNAAGVTLHPASLLNGAVSGIPDDGVTRAGVQTFEVYVEPA